MPIKCKTLSDLKPKIYKDDRLSACKRGYGHKWRKFREWYIKRHPLCVDPLNRHIYRTVATEHIHHIKSLKECPELQYTESNCMPLCQACHNAMEAKG